MYKVFKKKYNQSMRKLLILIFCLMLAACAGNRTIDGETTKDWVKIVSSRVDNTGTIRDVCFLFDLSFSPESAYERIEHNPASCLEQCCWYSENKSVDFYFNDGFTKDLQEFGVSRKYYPDHIKIKMKYSPFLNRLSASVSSDVISKDGTVYLDYEDINSSNTILNSKFNEFEAKTYTEEDLKRDSMPKTAKKTTEPISYKTISMSGMNRDELLAKAQAEAEKDRAHAEEISSIYSTVTEGEEISTPVALQVQEKSTKVKEAIKQNKEEIEQEAEQVEQQVEQQVKETKAVIPATMKANKAKAEEVMYDVQKTAEEDNRVIAENLETKIDTLTLKQKLAYERKQAVELLKRFYGDEIDAYLRFLDNAKKKEGQVLLTSDKVWQAKKIGTPIYKISCKVRGKIALLGTNADTETTDYPIICGSYIVNLDEKTVEAKDALAKNIVQKKY